MTRIDEENGIIGIIAERRRILREDGADDILLIQRLFSLRRVTLTTVGVRDSRLPENRKGWLKRPTEIRLFGGSDDVYNEPLLVYGPRCSFPGWE